MRPFGFVTRHPGFVAAATVSIALAVGANAAIFSIVNALWLRPLPVDEPDRLVVPYRPVVHSDDGEILDFYTASSVPDLRRVGAFSAVSYELFTGGLMALWEPMVRLRDTERVLSTAIVSHEYFETLGVRIHGRGFIREDEVESGEVAGVVSHEFWRHTLGSSPHAIGSKLDTRPVPVRIVGIAPSHFRGARLGQSRDLWVTTAGLTHFSDLGGSPDTHRFMPVTVYARLKADVSMEAATAQVRRVIDRRTTLQSLRDLSYPLRSTGDLARQSSIIRVLWAAAGLVLLLGCANLAALAVARSESQRHDDAIRRCLGATPRQLLLRPISEAAVICALGFAGGLLIRFALLEVIGELQVAFGVPVASLDARVDLRVLVFGAIISVLATVIAGAGASPLLRRRDLASVVSATATTGTRAAIRLRQALLGTHVALCTALLAAGLALAANVSQALRADLGYESGNVLFVSLRPRLSDYDRLGDEGASLRLATDIAAALEGVRSLPHVRAAAQGAELLGVPPQASAKTSLSDGGTTRVPGFAKRVGPAYLTAIGARFISGRDLDESDIRHAVDPNDVIKRMAQAASTGKRYSAPGGRPLAVIDRTLAEALWPGEPAVGRTVVRPNTGVRYAVVGVIDAVRYNTTQPAAGSLFEIQAPQMQDLLRPQHFVVRTEGPAEEQSEAVISTFRRAFPDALQLSVRSARALIAEERSRERMGATVFSWFGLAAAALGLTGTYGLVAFLVLRQKRELGIRAAMGARASQLMALVARRAVLPSALGACGGVVIAYWASKALSNAVAGVSTTGYWPSAIAAAGLVLASLAAALLAARGVRKLRASDLLRST
jgi:predicted permease